MDTSHLPPSQPISEGVKLITVVAPSKGEGSSPTGLVGRRLAQQLLAVGDPVRAFAEPEECSGWPDDVHLVTGSVSKPLAFGGIFAGVDAMFLAGAHPATVEATLALARDAGVRRVVLLSSHGPEYEQWNPPETWYWLAIERAVEHCGIAWTHIRPSAVMGSVISGTYPATGSDWADSIRTEGVVREAFLDNGHYPFIHEDDLAAVAAAAMRTDRYIGSILEAVGLPLSTRARVRSIAEAIGRDIRGIELTSTESRAVWQRNGWPDGAIDVTLYALQEYGARLAELTEWTLRQRPSVTDIIGRPPRTYDEWAVENAHLFR
ncbi:nucleotide-diphosphate-sugar epimerase [Virgisporangium aliadipatigenens]|uniref:Nucleotide-diphosphate-sugar epimerase n=1 Tax=Virgisporangium aliadipatigenens TaxID=741659 RepID=A0A8J3YX73_9ACTN|nr:NAD(P)H-binding protein [Virgisporangium aliadipatigenens]GIJ51396.1 nucleotide-diphosphate-sugar epimerase [Virgisporangium aliadipatigenens]